MATFGPYTDHDRTAHQESGKTLHQALINKGFTEDDIETALNTETVQRSFGLGTLDTNKDEAPVLGIVYSGDYKHEEEAGAAAIAENLAKFENQEDLFGEVDHDSDVRVFAAVAKHLIQDDAARSVSTALSRHRNPYNSTFHLWRRTVAELRADLKAAGVKPLPKKRDDVELAYLEHIDGKPVKRTETVGEFQIGKLLALVTDEPILIATLEHLSESAKANALSLGSSSNPFSRGILFFDVREVPNTTVHETYAEEQWHQDRMDEAADAIQALKESGSLYAISPSRFTGEVIGRPHSTDGGVFYFVNYSPRNGKQLHGWMSIDDLHKIAAGEITRDTLAARDDKWREWSEKEGSLSRHPNSGITRIS